MLNYVFTQMTAETLCYKNEKYVCKRHTLLGIMLKEVIKLFPDTDLHLQYILNLINWERECLILLNAH
jgi:hypothetical protein